jgi:uncharacterized membrane protein
MVTIIPTTVIATAVAISVAVVIWRAPVAVVIACRRPSRVTASSPIRIIGATISISITITVVVIVVIGAIPRIGAVEVIEIEAVVIRLVIIIVSAVRIVVVIVARYFYILVATAAIIGIATTIIGIIIVVFGDTTLYDHHSGVATCHIEQECYQSDGLEGTKE